MEVQNSSQYLVNSKQEKPKNLSAVYCLLSAKKGFTLIETIIVMVIAVILAAVVAVRWSPFDAIKLNSATRKVAADIRYAQKVAISTQTRSGIEFTGNGYCVFSDITLRTGVCLPSNALASSPGDVCSSDASNKFVVDFTQSRCSSYSGIAITPPGTNPFAFNSLGTPVDATGTAVGNQTVTVTYQTGQTITIDAGTGRVSY